MDLDLPKIKKVTSDSVLFTRALAIKICKERADLIRNKSVLTKLDFNFVVVREKLENCTELTLVISTSPRVLNSREDTVFLKKGTWEKNDNTLECALVKIESLASDREIESFFNKLPDYKFSRMYLPALDVYKSRKDSSSSSNIS
jgi:hypothetical protein